MFYWTKMNPIFLYVSSVQSENSKTKQNPREMHRMIADCSGVLLDIRHAPESYLLGCGARFYCSTSPNVFKLSVRMIRTSRNSKINQKHAKWTGTMRKPTISNTSRQIASATAIAAHYPTLILPTVNKTLFFSFFFIS